jgi:2',3'-cyclic-nucleotide 2'-phosphodiesterase (5'-nucleotidase family)
MGRIFLILCALLVCGACAKPAGPALTIYHTNDIQGFYWARPSSENDNKETGGLPVFKKMLDKQPAGFLLFDSGDSFSKTQEGQLGKLEGAVRLMNLLGYTAVTLSAADFSFGWDNMEAALAKAGFAVVVSNVQNADGSQPKHIKKYIFIERGGLKTAVLGLASKKAFPGIQRNAGLKINDELETLKNLIPLVQEEGADFIILLSSLGFELEAGNKPDEKTIAEEFPEINLILGGNGDVSPAGAEQISNTYIARAKPMLFEAAKITIPFNAKKQPAAFNYEQILLDKETYGEEEETASAVAAARAAVKKITGRKITTLPFALESYGDKPSPLGVYTAQCLKRWTSNDAGIINSDLFLQGFAAGPLTEAHLLNAVPFNDRVMLVKMRGDEIKNALEHTIEAKNNWPQTAGIAVNYDPAAPFGSRIKKITVNGAPLRDGALYSISTSDHIMAGGFGHNEFINAFEFKNTDRTVRDILKWCLYRQKEFSAPQLNQWEQSR